MKFVTLASVLLIFGLVSPPRVLSQTEANLLIECFPNGTVVVDNPHTDRFQTSFANSTSALCNSTYNDDFTKLTITGCPLSDDIVLVFTNRTEDFDLIIGGHEVDGYIIQCENIGTGVSRAFTLGVSPTLSAAMISSVTLQLSLISALRNGSSFDEAPVTSAVLTTQLYWTIDVAAQYYSNPTQCTVYSGSTVSAFALSKTIISDACSHDQDLVGNFGNFLDDAMIRRNWALFHVFKFYDSDYITISCVVVFCINEVDCTPDCNNRQGRSVSKDGVEEQVAVTTLRVIYRSPIMASNAPMFVPGISLIFVIIGQILI